MIPYIYSFFDNKLERIPVSKVEGDKVYPKGWAGWVLLGGEYFATEEEAIAQEFKECHEEVQSLREALHDSLAEFKAIRKKCPKTLEELRGKIKRANY